LANSNVKERKSQKLWLQILSITFFVLS